MTAFLLETLMAVNISNPVSTKKQRHSLFAASTAASTPSRTELSMTEFLIILGDPLKMGLTALNVFPIVPLMAFPTANLPNPNLHALPESKSVTRLSVM